MTFNMALESGPQNRCAVLCDHLAYSLCVNTAKSQINSSILRSFILISQQR